MPLRFHIRDLIWLTIVVALAFGWWLNLGQVASQRDQARREARDATNTLDRYRAAYTSQPGSSATSSAQVRRQWESGDRAIPAN